MCERPPPRGWHRQAPPHPQAPARSGPTRSCASPLRRERQREDLGWIQPPARVEDILHVHLGGKIGIRKLVVHEIALLDTDTMLAGQAAARFDAKLQDLGPERLGPRQLALARIEDDQRMHVAIARME